MKPHIYKQIALPLMIFTDQPNLSVNNGVHVSLHPNYHLQSCTL